MKKPLKVFKFGGASVKDAPSIKNVIEILKEADLVQQGDIVINTGSMPLHERKKTNMLKVTVVR